MNQDPIPSTAAHPPTLNGPTERGEPVWAVAGDDVLVLNPDPAAVRLARAFVATRCQRTDLDQDAHDTAALLTSEVVTNAFLHGRTQTRLTVTTTAHTVLVQVSDDNSRHPAPTSADQGALGGRGMNIIDALATGWGIRTDPLGKTVWFTIST